MTVETNKKTQQTVVRRWDGAQLVEVCFALVCDEKSRNAKRVAVVFETRLQNAPGFDLKRSMAERDDCGSAAGSLQ